MTLDEFLRAFAKIGGAAFRERYSSPVLISLKAIGQLVDGDDTFLVRDPGSLPDLHGEELGQTQVAAPTRNVFQIDRTSNVTILDKSPIRVGRGSENELCLPDKTVSKVHATLASSPNGWTIQAHKSTNVTTVDGEELSADQAVLLQDGAKIGLGPDVRMKFHRPGSFAQFVQLFAAQGNRQNWLTL
jgi:pSer/pThr/pTyr-binding forkhead associated (FHA) protein